MDAPRLPSTSSPLFRRRTILGTLAGATAGLAGCGAIRSDDPPPTPGKQLEVEVFNFHDTSVTFDVSVVQDETTIYDETVALEAVSEGQYVSSSDSVQLPEVATTTVSGTIQERDQTTSTTVPYDKLPSGYGFRFGLDGEAELGLWSIH
jgi:hypothetical protein